MIKRLFLALMVLAIALAAALVIRALMFTSAQVAVDPAPELDLEERAQAERLAKALTFKTISNQNPIDFDGAPYLAFHAFLEETFPLTHDRLERETVNNYSLLYRWLGSDPSLKPILLLAHEDVVPVTPGTEDDWTYPPFGGIVAEEIIWGRGAMDMKGPLMGIFEAVERLLADGAQPKRTLYIALGHDEEVGGKNGAQAISKLLESRNVEPEFILDEGGLIIDEIFPGLEKPLALIMVAEKGYVSLSLTVEAEGGHSSQPPKETAIGSLARAVHALQTHPFPGGLTGPAREMFLRVGPEAGFAMRLVTANLWLFAPVLEGVLGDNPAINALMRTTTAPTIFQSGIKDNVLPQRARAVVNFRIRPGESIDTVVEYVTEVIDNESIHISVLDGAQDPSTVSPSSGPQWSLLEETVREVLPDAVVAPSLQIGGTDSRHYRNLTDRVYLFSAMRIKSDELSMFHGTNERVEVSDYTLMVRYYHRLLEKALL